MQKLVADWKIMKDYDKSKESWYLQYWDVNNLYGCEMSQKFPVNNFRWVENTSQFKKDFIKSYNQNSDEGHFLEVDFKNPEEVNDLHNFLSLLPKRMKIEEWKLATSLDDKKEYVIHIRNLKQALSQRLLFKKLHRVIKANQKTWLKLCIDFNKELKKKAKNDFDLMNNIVFGKAMENVRKHRDIKLVTTEKMETIPCHNQIIIEQNFCLQIY